MIGPERVEILLKSDSGYPNASEGGVVFSRRDLA